MISPRLCDWYLAVSEVYREAAVKSMAWSLKFSFKPAVNSTPPGSRPQNYWLKFENWFDLKVLSDIFSNSELNVRCLPTSEVFRYHWSWKVPPKRANILLISDWQNFPKTILLCYKKRIDQFSWRPLCSKSPLLEAAQLKIESSWKPENRKGEKMVWGTFCTKSIHIQCKMMIPFISTAKRCS